MPNGVFEFLDRHSSLILTTHDPADADGLGAEKTFALLAQSLGKQVRVVNSSPTPDKFRFLDPDNTIEAWKTVNRPIDRESALVIFDTADEYHIGDLRQLIPCVAEIFVIDHHEPNSFSSLKGYIDNTASSTCEIVVELAREAGVALTPECARAAYTGLVYDTGFFGYAKTTDRTFKTALALIEAGARPYEVYQELNENTSAGALLLQKIAFSTLEFHHDGRVAVQVLLKKDLESTGAHFEDSENFVNLPLKSREVLVSVLIKQTKEGQTRCSLRSKGTVNVSKIAQALGGGGHVSSAGFRSSLSPDETLTIVLKKIKEEMDKTV